MAGVGSDETEAFEKVFGFSFEYAIEFYMQVSPEVMSPHAHRTIVFNNVCLLAMRIAFVMDVILSDSCRYAQTIFSHRMYQVGPMTAADKGKREIDSVLAARHAALIFHNCRAKGTSSVPVDVGAAIRGRFIGLGADEVLVHVDPKTGQKHVIRLVEPRKPYDVGLYRGVYFDHFAKVERLQTGKVILNLSHQYIATSIDPAVANTFSGDGKCCVFDVRYDLTTSPFFVPSSVYSDERFHKLQAELPYMFEEAEIVLPLGTSFRVVDKRNGPTTRHPTASRSKVIVTLEATRSARVCDQLLALPHSIRMGPLDYKAYKARTMQNMLNQRKETMDPAGWVYPIA